jgi:hypothetical protein
VRTEVRSVTASSNLVVSVVAALQRIRYTIVLYISHFVPVFLLALISIHYYLPQLS